MDSIEVHVPDRGSVYVGGNGPEVQLRIDNHTINLPAPAAAAVAALLASFAAASNGAPK